MMLAILSWGCASPVDPVVESWKRETLKAHAHLRARQWVLARESLERAVELASSMDVNPDAVIETATMVGAVGQVPAIGSKWAVAKLRRLLESLTAEQDAYTRGWIAWSLGSTLYAQRGSDEATRYNRMAVEIFAQDPQRPSAKHPEAAELHARATGNLALSLGQSGQLDEATETAERALELKRQALGPDDPSTLRTQVTLADFEVGRGNEARALPLFEAALPELRSKDPQSVGSLPTWQRGYAICLLRLGKTAEANAAFEQGMSDLDAAVRRNPSQAVMNLLSITVHVLSEAQWAWAEQSLLATLEILGGSRTSPPRPFLAKTWIHLGLVYQILDRPEEAERFYQRAVEKVRRPRDPDERFLLGEGELLYGRFLASRGRDAEAAAAIERAMALGVAEDQLADYLRPALAATGP